MLTPIESVYQMRPSFAHVDSEAATRFLNKEQVREACTLKTYEQKPKEEEKGKASIVKMQFIDVPVHEQKRRQAMLDEQWS